VVTPVRYAFRSFDRQWIIPDNRLLNRPNPTLWDWHSKKQIYLTALNSTAPGKGPGLTFSASIPDIDHYNARGGRVFPLWKDPASKVPNVQAGIMATLAEAYDAAVTADDVMAYIAAVAAHPAYAIRFRKDLVQPGLRIPLTADPALFKETITLGREVIWLQVFGEHFGDQKAGRPTGAPRMASGKGPTIPAGGAIPSDEDQMPDTITYDPSLKRLQIGTGYIDNVAPEVWAYEISGQHVLQHWFSYRKKDRSRPIIGDKRPPSPLGDIQPGWLPEYTSELLNVLHVLGRLIPLEAMQADLLQRICDGKLIDATALPDGVIYKSKRKKKAPAAQGVLPAV
jgi:Type ISP C-terminal specificity domain